MNDLAPTLKILLPQIRELIVSVRRAVARTVNTLQVVTNYEIGRLIVEHEQKGAKRAQYGKALLKELSASLITEFGKGFSQSNLEYMRRFYLLYRNRTPRIAQTVSGQLAKPTKSQTPSGQSVLPEKSQTLSDELSISETVSRKSALPERFHNLAAQFPLSWSHYVFLTGIDNPDERSFYEIEAASQGWSLRELKRQFSASLYERLALSRDKDKVRELSDKGQIIESAVQRRASAEAYGLGQGGRGVMMVWGRTNLGAPSCTRPEQTEKEPTTRRRSQEKAKREAATEKLKAFLGGLGYA